MGGPRNGVYTAYHGTNDSGGASLLKGGIDANKLRVPDQFHLTTDPAVAHSYAMDQVATAGGLPRYVKYLIPEDMLRSLFAKGNIRLNNVVKNGLILDEEAQKPNSLPRGNCP